MPQEVDHLGARELALWMESSSTIDRRSGFFILNGIRKARKGQYDVAKGTKLWRYLVDEAVREYGGYHPNGATRDYVASLYSEEFAHAFKAGAYEHVNAKPGAPNPIEEKTAVPLHPLEAREGRAYGDIRGETP